MGPIPAPARPTFPIDTPNREHGYYDDDEEIDEEAPTGDTDVTAKKECLVIKSNTHRHFL